MNKRTLFGTTILYSPEGAGAAPVTVEETSVDQNSNVPELTENDLTAFLKEDASDSDVDVEVPAKGSTPALAPKDGQVAEPVPGTTAIAAPVAPTPVVPGAVTQPEVPPTTAVAAPAPTVPEAPRITVEEIQKTYRESRAAAEALIASSHYKLDDATLLELDENPSAAIPKLLARVYMDAITGAVSHMVQHLPAMIGRVAEGQTTATKAEEEFFQAWPQLAGKNAEVSHFGVQYRKMFPQASKADFIRDVGAQVVVALKLPFNGAGAQAPVAPTPPAPPFRPAGAGTGAIPAPRQGSKPSNPFEAFAEEMMHDDLASTE